MIGWHHRLNPHEFEQDPFRDGEGQGVLGGVPRVCWAAPGLHFPPAHARGGAAMQIGVHPRLAQPRPEP